MSVQEKKTTSKMPKILDLKKKRTKVVKKVQEKTGPGVRSPPTKVIGSPQSTTTRSERRVHFSNVARMKLIPADQFPPRPLHPERAIPNPNRRLWVLFRLFKIGGRYRNKRNSRDQVPVAPNTPWPPEWGPPPPPVQYKQMQLFDPPSEEDSES